MTNDNTDNKKTEKDTAPERGKKIIDAGKKAKGENPESPEVKANEEKDAAAWRNEG